MEHSEYIKEIRGSSTAILFIHGILGTPNHFNKFIDIVPEGWSVYNILLAGHGKGVDDFSAASMRQWKSQVSRQMEMLAAKYESIFIVGHSMGTLFAIDASSKYSEKVKGLFLLAVPLKPFVRLSAIKGLLKVIFNRVKSDDKIAAATEREYSLKPDKRLWKYGKWISNYLKHTKTYQLSSKCLHTNTECICFYLVFSIYYIYISSHTHERNYTITETTSNLYN